MVVSPVVGCCVVGAGAASSLAGGGVVVVSSFFLLQLVRATALISERAMTSARNLFIFLTSFASC